MKYINYLHISNESFCLSETLHRNLQTYHREHVTHQNWCLWLTPHCKPAMCWIMCFRPDYIKRQWRKRASFLSSEPFHHSEFRMMSCDLLFCLSHPWGQKSVLSPRLQDTRMSPFESSHSDIPPPSTAHVLWSTDAGMLHNWVHLRGHHMLMTLVCTCGWLSYSRKTWWLIT